MCIDRSARTHREQPTVAGKGQRAKAGTVPSKYLISGDEDSSGPVGKCIPDITKIAVPRWKLRPKGVIGQIAGWCYVEPANFVYSGNPKASIFCEIQPPHGVIRT